MRYAIGKQRVVASRQPNCDNLVGDDCHLRMSNFMGAPIAEMQAN
jgi:hypothetical protein